MIQHIVLFKAKSELDGSELVSLKTKIKMVNISFGKNFTERGKGYTHALVVKFETKQDLENYIVDPLHKEGN